MTELDDGPGSRRRRPVTEAQWARARELTEGRPATRARVAGALGVDVSSLYAHAAAEGWTSVDYRRQDVLALHREAVELSASHAASPALAGEWADETDDAGGAVEDATATGAAECADAAASGAARAASRANETRLIDSESDPVALLARASQFVSRQILRLMVQAEQRGGRLDKAQIDGLVALSRMMERWEAMARERAGEDKKKNDEELAQMLREIDDRIITLAQAEAERLFQERVGQGVL